MSVNDPAVPGSPANGPANEPPPPPPASPPSPAVSDGAAEPARDQKPAKDEDPLRGSFTSHTWIALIGLVVVLILIAVFVLQNTADVTVNYFGFTGESPLAVALLLAFAAGLLVAGIAGTLRIWQLRRRVKKLAR